MTAKPVSFKTIEGETIDASFDEVVSPQTMKIVPGKGMPIEQHADPLAPLKKNYKKGNLVVKFDIQFPTGLTQEKKEALSAVLEEIDEQ